MTTMEEALLKEEADMADISHMVEAVETLTLEIAEEEAGKVEREETMEGTEEAKVAIRIETSNGVSNQRTMDLSIKTNKIMESKSIL